MTPRSQVSESRRLMPDRGFRWWLADRLRPNAWPSTAAQHAALLDEIERLSTITDAMVERGAQAAFFRDDLGGHIAGRWTWATIPDEGRENYRAMVRDVLTAALVERETDA